MPGPIQAIERAAAVLSVLARAPYGVGVSEIAGALGLAKGTAHGLLRTLMLVGFVEQSESGRYALGSRLPDSRSREVDGNVLRAHAMTWADGLVSRTGLSARVATLHDQSAVVVHHVFRPGDPAQTLRLGVRLPLHATALGKALLAFTPGLAEQRTGTDLVSYTSRTVTTTREVASALSAVRSHGWAADTGEFRADRASVAAPIRDRGGRVVGAIAVVGTVDAVTAGRGSTGKGPDPALTDRVREAARAVGDELGGDP